MYGIVNFMASNPNDIRLSMEHRRRLAEAADRAGTDWSIVLTEAMDLWTKRRRTLTAVDAGIAQADQGELVDADQVWERLEQRAEEIEDGSR